MNVFGWLVLAGGVLHFGLLPAGMLVPIKLDFRRELAKVDPLLRQLVWVYYIFIALCILGFGTMSLLLPTQLSDGTLLARTVCGFIGLFWTTRLAIQLFVFTATPHLDHWFLKIGYHALTGIFLYHAVAYTFVAIAT